MDLQGFCTDRHVMAIVLSVTFIPSAILLVISMESDILANIPRMVSAIGMPHKIINDVTVLQHTKSMSRQVHIQFYNPPEWFNKNIALRGCPSNCSMSTGSRHYHDKDVVIFFGPRLGPKPVPKKRGQIWVLHGKEAPPNHNHITKWRGLFNWTMTYRRDSDFPHMYGEFRSVDNPSARLPNTTMKFVTVHNSTKFPKLKKVPSTAWFVSHCRTQSKRQEYVRSLRGTHSVDVFGACGINRCDKNRDRQCLSPYKFYLSFENSLCRDYITEKAFKIYFHEHDSVPITRGFKGMYQLYLPPGSFIDTSDHRGIDHLGRFLNTLSKNQTSHSQFFKWRLHYQPRVDHYFPFCELCNRMQKPDVYTRYHRLYQDINQWVFGSPDDKICTEPTDLHK
ncbi:alpha-(1,3)-fucosyltransferase C-like [Ylistrum balloti]|uniref:alpha-(1,3)-fucosyltransferase C-like n=1 Tax=Ylistrum balloti TaxID=509963 RepID=UPI002905EA1D|nr:alpha-(1,3)-fucosyltransferase C-like [Ylistrum balloti]